MSEVIKKGGPIYVGSYMREQALENRVKELEAALRRTLEDAESAMNVANRYGGGEFDIDECLADARAVLKGEP